jgi:hypothetical protein
MVLKKMVRISCKGKSSVMKEKILKKTIDYSRAYRYMNVNKANVVMVALFTILILAIYITYYKEISYAFAVGAIAVLKPVFPDASLHLASTLFTQGYYLYYVDTVGAFPSLLFSWGNIVFTLLFLLFVRFILKTGALSVFLSYISLIHLVSCIFFIFWPEYFPYTAATFSEIYIKQQATLSCFVVIIMGFAVLLPPLHFIQSFLALGSLAVYSMIFGFVRYITFLFILYKFSVLYMCVLFFVLGPFIDFLYLVGIYSLAVCKAAGNLKVKREIWQW